jgi:3-methyladenine DNA glycosylase AlkD
MDFLELKQKFENGQDPARATQMAAYMRNKFSFYGYQSAPRKAVYHQDLLAEKKKKVVDWALLDQGWADEHREMQYFVCDYLIAMKRYLVYEDIAHIERYVRSKQWWDTIDSLIKPIGYMGLQDPRVDDLMRRWSVDKDIWVRRVAIEHQLLRKDKMKTGLLAEILTNNLNSKDFFINKAIGWALRDYSKTNPTWVKEFIADHADGLAPLSIKEGSKYL